jgi:hypothetical protein
MTQRQQSGFLKDIQGAYIPKDPNATLQFGIDWADWLDAGDSITTSTFQVETTGTNLITIVDTSVVSNIASATLSGGTTGTVYTIANTISTVEGWTDTRRFRVKVDKRYL